MSATENLYKSAAACSIAVVVPCYRVVRTIGAVLSSMPDYVDQIICVDDGCPENSGQYIEETSTDSRVTVLYHDSNQGVGGAVITGFEKALEDGADVIAKIDGDGQMDPQLLAAFVDPIIMGEADYTKGNRFFWVSDLESMPKLRIVGNGILSFLTKLSSGYWNIFDPTNGYIAIHAAVLSNLPLRNISKDYFFESDMLYQLGVVQAVVKDIPMSARYGEEESNLAIRKIVFPFLRGHLRNLMRRVIYTYYLRDFHLASLELLFGMVFLTFGTLFAIVKWAESVTTGVPATAGAVMIGALFIIVGAQMLLGAINYDIQRVPRSPIQRTLRRVKGKKLK